MCVLHNTKHYNDFALGQMIELLLQHYKSAEMNVCDTPSSAARLKAAFETKEHTAQNIVKQSPGSALLLY